MQFQDIGYAENKQRINLSDYAYEMLLFDQEVFGGKVDSTLRNKDENLLASSTINHIFRAYRNDAMASISVAVSKERMRLNEILSSVPEGETAVDLITKDYETKLRSYAQSSLKKKGKSLSFRIDRENEQYLATEGMEEDSHYHGSVGKYLKAVLEEYASFPQAQRELIYFKEQLDEIALACQKKRMLKVTLRTKSSNGSGQNNIVYVKPVSVRTDAEQLYHYLIGYCSTEITGEWHEGSIRLTSILDCRASAHSGNVNEKMQKRLEEAVVERGVPYVSSDVGREKIVVELSERGIQMYRKILHMRPKCTSQNGNLFEFQCSPYQAENYFFRFGHHAKIIQPEYLSAKMRERFSLAAEHYKSTV